MIRTGLILFVLLQQAIVIPPAGQGSEVTELLVKSREYESRLETQLDGIQQKHRQILEKCETYRQLFSEGLVARIRLEAQEDELKVVDEELNNATSQLQKTRELRLEIQASVAGQKDLEKTLMERSSGGQPWDLGDLPALSVYYQNRFGEALPISALGQTPIHTQLGFDHRGGADLAIHPDSDAGKALLLYLRQQEIPFIAFRAAVSGAATGAHIHVGPPSDRLGAGN